MLGKLRPLIRQLPNIPSKSSRFALGLFGACWLCLQPSAYAQTLGGTALSDAEFQDGLLKDRHDVRSVSAYSERGELPHLPLSDAAPLDVDVRAGSDAGFSRLEFDWPAPVGHDLWQHGNYIVVTFDRPGRMDISPLVAGLGGRLIGAMVEDNGQRLLLMTRGELEVRVHDDERERLVLDLIASTDEPTIRPASLDRPIVDVRAGEHAGFSRLVFDWPTPIGHDVQQDGDQIIISFDRPGRMDVSSLVARSGGRIAAATVEDNGRRVLLQSRGHLDVQIRDYESDLVVLDLVTAAPTSTDGAFVADDGARKAALDDIDAGPSRSRSSFGAASEKPAATEPVQRQHDAPDEPGVASASQTGPGQFDVDEDALDRALERTLTREGVLLLPAGKVEITPSFTYTRRESQAPTQVDLFGLFAQVRETEIRRDEYAAGISIGVGLPFDSQFEMSQGYTHVDQETMSSAGFVGLEDSDESADSFDDLVVGLAKGVLREDRWWPDIVARIRWDTDTGDDRDGDIGLGGGNHEAGRLALLRQIARSPRFLRQPKLQLCLRRWWFPTW